MSDVALLNRTLAIEVARVTEAAALAAYKLAGRGDEKAADQAAVDAMRRAFDKLEIDGTVVIGEGERDEAPMLFIGEKVGTGRGPKVDIALDPLEGTTLTAKSMPGAMAVVALAVGGTLLHAPDVYMDKIAIGGGYPAGVVDLDADPADNIAALAKAKGVQAIVLLVHEGGAPDKADPTKLTGEIVKLAEALDPAVNAVVSAHSHKEYVATIAGKTVIQAGSYGAALGEINLAVDKTTGKVTTTSARLIRNDQSGILPDPVVAKMVKAFEAKVAPRTQQVVTTLAAPLTNERNAAGETALGAVIADAQRAAAGADIGLMNFGGIRTSIKAGSVNWGQLFAVQPFGNRIQRVELTGAELLAVLEEQFTEARTNILQISGLTVHLDLTKPLGSRVVSVTTADGAPLDPKKTYKVAANAFLADGGDGYTKLKVARNREDIGDDLTALVDYLRANGAKVPTAASGRIVIDKGALPTDMH